MSAKKMQIRYYAARAITGTAVTLIAGASVYAATVISPNYPKYNPQPVTVTGFSEATTMTACTGAFAILGADPQYPDKAVPVGQLDLLTAGAAKRVIPSPLNREYSAESSYGTAFAVPEKTLFAAAGSQEVATENATGLAALTCSQPSTDQWLLGGKTTSGSTLTLSLANPGNKPATVKVSAYGSEGPVTSSAQAGAVVPAGQVRTISLNGIAPGLNETAVRVQATGAAVSATLGVSENHDIRPFGVELIAPQGSGDTYQIIPGVQSVYAQSASDAVSRSSNTLQVLATQTSGSATVFSLSPDGTRTKLTDLALPKQRITSFEIHDLPAGTSLVVDSSVPVIAAVSGTHFQTGKTDMVWFTPTPKLTGKTAVAVVPEGVLNLANPYGEQITVTVTGKNSAELTTLKLAPFATASVRLAQNSAILTSTGAVHAGVTVFNTAGAASYPVTPVIARQQQIQVYVD